MKRFIFFFSIFSLLYILIQAIIIRSVASKYKFSDSEMFYSKEFNNAFSSKKLDLIAIGNSKLLSSINKKIIEDSLKLKTANCGISSADISVSKLILETYLKSCIINPKIILMEVSWITFILKGLIFIQLQVI